MRRKELNKKFGVTDDQLDQMAKKYEDGSWDAPLGKVIMGRPSIASEEVRPVTVRIPISKIRAIDKQAEASGSTRSQLLRDAIDRYLIAG